MEGRMIECVGTISLYVKDQDKALDFYVNKLGLEKRADQKFQLPDGRQMRWLTVAPRDAITEIVLYKPVNWPQAEAFIGNFAGITFNTKDIQQTYKDLLAKGVKFTEPPTQQAWGGIQAQFNDQDDNGLVLVQLPSFQ
jgi:lactoylglutathione lyase